MIKRIIKEVYEYIQLFLSMFPGKIGEVLRRNFYKIFLKRQGSNFYTSIRVRIQGFDNLIVGDNVAINDSAWIAANSRSAGQIVIEDNVLVGPFSVIHSGNHVFADPVVPVNKQGFRFAPIHIESDVWIAAHCVILSGVRIGKGSVVAAGSVVTRDVPPFSIVGGVPAKVIGSRKST